MKIGAPKETYEGEARVAMTPASAKDLQKLGHDCLVQSGAGLKAGFTDDAYRAADVTVVDDACATVSDELHQASLSVLNFRYANVVTTKEVVNEVRRESYLPQEER